jgi:hypothetical protein
MKKLRAADSADAIVDGLRWRRAEVYVPSLLRPLSVLDLALPRRIKRIVQRTFTSENMGSLKFIPAVPRRLSPRCSFPPRRSHSSTALGRISGMAPA